LAWLYRIVGDMNFYRYLSAAALVLAVAAPAARAETACPVHFAGGQAPQITNQRMAAKARELCYRGFAVMHSGITRTPLWSAEHLTRENVESARSQVRVNDFHPESRLPSSERSELSDFSHSGLDRGHLTPSGDAGDAATQQETFTLANMIPQAAVLNRGMWEGIESAVRTMAQRRGQLYVITGPLFEGDHLKSLKSRVLVPTSVYKIVYDPQRKEAAAYVATNTDSPTYEVVNIAALEARAGIDFFPGMSSAAKHKAMDLPSPTEHGHGKKPHSRHTGLLSRGLSTSRLW